MQAIEFEAIAQHHTLRLPDQVPDGVRLRVLVLMEEGSHNALTEKPPVDRPRRQPSPMLAGTVVMQDDLLAPAAPEDDWSALQ
ncbi:hypothetical protein [Thiocystis violacea]|uniref:hypothetical protein n=1 Tax=Thiocystis violacea TaxID=13725 RepID=UPI0019064E76|nr:hypothetical protein [Thiocystis violacea]MBK1719643.1 hypothetical protein [Thiocystis violacea]